MASLSLPPPSRVAVGSVLVNGQKLDVILNPEWARYLESLNTQVVTTSNAVGQPGAPGTTGAAGAAVSFAADSEDSVEFIPLAGQQGPKGDLGPALFVLQSEPDTQDAIPHQGTQPTEPVIAPTFLNAWSNLGSGFTGAGYFKDQSGIVHLRGLVTGGTVGAAIFNLPAGYRPSAQESFAIQSNNVFGRCDVTPAGDVFATAGSNVYFSLSGISFRPA